MRSVLVTSLIVLLVLAPGCAQREKETAKVDEKGTTVEKTSYESTEVLTPEQLGELGAQIKKSPDRAKELLSQHGLDEKSFEAQIRKITEDPEASKKYAEAYKKASA